MAALSDQREAAIDQLHGLAGPMGLDVKVMAWTTHDERSEITKASVEVSEPGMKGATVAHRFVALRETEIGRAIELVAQDALERLEELDESSTRLGETDEEDP